MKRAVEDIASSILIGIRNDRRVYEITTGQVFTETGVHSLHRSEAYMLDSEPGVFRWESNDRCIPMDICKRLRRQCDDLNLEAQELASEAELDALLTAMRKADEEFEADTSPEAEAIRAEQAFERRAAFGPGAEVVNVITGRRYRT